MPLGRNKNRRKDLSDQEENARRLKALLDYIKPMVSNRDGSVTDCPPLFELMRLFAQEITLSRACRLWGGTAYDTENDPIDHFFIKDFTVDIHQRSCGYGSALMERFIRYAKSLQIVSIIGALSFVDMGIKGKRTEDERLNRKALHKFYKKHGFTIDINDNICLPLNDELL